jgi:PAS domain S-box-containing protein
MPSVATIVRESGRGTGGGALLAALDDAPFGIAVLDARGRLIDASAGVGRLLALPYGEPRAGIAATRLITGYDAALEEGGFPVKGDRWVHWVARPGPDGGRAVTLRDTSEERSRLAALTRSENRFRDLTEISADWFWETDPELRFTYFSTRHETAMGTPNLELTGRRRDQLENMVPGQETLFAENLAVMRRQEPFREFEYDRYDSWGRIRRMSVSGLPFFDDDGRFAGYRGTARDVTAVTRLSDQLRVERAWLEELMSNAPIPIVFKDLDLRFVMANDAFLKDVGVSLPNLVGKTAGEALPEADLLAITSLDIGVLENRRPRMREIVHGDQIFNVCKFPVFDKEKTLIGIGGMMFNVTDRIQERQALAAAKNEAERASVAKSNFLARMSHELRTPLNAVIGFGEAMQAEIFGPIEQPRYREYVADIIHSGQGLLALVSDILDLSKIEADEFTLHEEEIDLSTHVRRAVALTEAGRHSEGVAVKRRGIDPDIRVRGDAAAIERIVINLVGNALKFTPAGGAVAVSLWRKDGHARLEVRDTGVGIPSHALPEITQAFTTGGDPLSLNTEGAGLGLAIVRALCDAHGARFQIDSEEGVGTVCTVTFPPERVL